MLADSDVRYERAERIEATLDELERVANLPDPLDDTVPFGLRKRDYGAFWQKAREVSALFRGGGLSREDRERLWVRQSALCEQVRDLQNREHEERSRESRMNGDDILFVLREARNWAIGAENLDHLQEARSRLRKAMTLMREQLLLGDDRERCWTLWQEVNALVRDRRAEFVVESRRECERRREEWRGRQEARLGQIEAAVEKNEWLVAQIREEINDLEEKVASAWNEEWADRARGWVRKKYEKIAAIERISGELEERMRGIREKVCVERSSRAF